MSVSTAPAKPATTWLPLSTVATKQIVAVTGLALIAFVIVHMIGNLQIFLGQETLNAYAHFLKAVPELLWAARIGLLTIFVVHVTLGVLVRLKASEARSTPYVLERKLVTTRAARYMLVSGLLVLFFILYHLAHFTLGWTTRFPHTDPATGQMVYQTVFELRDPRGYQDVYSMVVRSFQQPAISILYVIAQLLLAFHLYHGASSLFQTLGVNNRRINNALAWFGPAIALVIAIGNISIPVAVLTGFIQLPVGG
jgi:succinate dehydrogenase / fumarate reductase cytochrome b subunit